MSVEFPRKATALFQPAPFKVMHGGRGSSKSWNFARALLILGSNRKLFIVCAREIQRSIKESVHKLLCDQIDGLGLRHFYRITETEIEGLNGTRIVFVGIRNNVSAIKSMEAIDIFAVSNATSASRQRGTDTASRSSSASRRAPSRWLLNAGSVWIDTSAGNVLKMI